MRRTIVCASVLALCANTAALAAQNATYTGPQSVAEKAFVTSIQIDLMKRFHTAADAEKAGYVRYTTVDDTGAISYANCEWQSTDPKHPSQLWYDRKGQLLGADYSVMLSESAVRPRLWGINPGRWVALDGHQHWVKKEPATGALTYDLWMPDAKFAAAGGDVEHPSARALVEMHKVKSASEVVRIFHFLRIWDLMVWVKPNTNGAFAEKNPAVTPRAAWQKTRRAARPKLDGKHDFDFQFGTWNVHVSRLVHPLTGSTTWVQYDGTHVVQKVWNGRANLGVLEIDGSAGHIEGLSLRLYNPQSHQWSANFSNSKDGTLGQASIGAFNNGRGEFHDHESYNGRAIDVRTITSDITPKSHRDEQAFSADGGKTWEVNWIATYTRVRPTPRG
jgi:hypothetical protein